MKLLYLASIDFPQVKARAIQVVNTCHALARAGCQVTLVVGQREPSPLDGYLARFGLEPHPALRLVGVPALRLPPGSPTWLRSWYTRFWNWSYLAGCLALLPRLIGRGPDALLARDYRLAWLLLKLQRLHARPLVFEVHGLPSAELVDTAKAADKAGREILRRRQLEEAVFDGAWRLITITECLRQRLIRDYGVEPTRIFTVPDASAATLGHPMELRTTSHGLADGDRPTARRATLVYAGQLYAHKGVDLLLEALVELPEAELLIIGGLPNDPQRRRLERLADELGVSERIRLTGPQPYARVPELLRDADVALLPLAEGIVARCFTSPLKLFDYLAAGLPIVAVDYPTIREILRDGENCLLVPPNDPAALATAIRRLLNDRVLASRLRQQARLDAADYTWDRRAERLLAAFGPRTPVAERSESSASRLQPSR